MALARVQYLGDGKTNSFSVPFPYIKQDDIVARIDGDKVGYSFISSSTITLDTTPAQDAVIDVRRVTEREHILVDYKDGSTLTESDLDKAARQTFFLAQESFDQTGSTMSVADDGSFLASYRRISALGDPKNDDDAATQGYVKQVLTSGKNAHEEHLAAEQEADRADARANEAAASQKAAADSESQAGEYLAQTKTHEQGAKDAQTGAETAESGATTQAQNAAGSADRAESEADRSESEADRAKGYANGLNIPSAVDNGGRLLAQSISEGGLEYVDRSEILQAPYIDTEPNIDDENQSSLFWTRWAGSSENRGTSPGDYYGIFNLPGNDSYIGLQFAAQYGSGDHLRFRRKSDNENAPNGKFEWQPWLELLHSGNILSEIIDYSRSGNAASIRFKGGLQIEINIWQRTVPVPENLSQEISFSRPFTSAPVVSLNCTGDWSEHYGSNRLDDLNGYGYSIRKKFVSSNPPDSSNYTWRLSHIAIGFWK